MKKIRVAICDDMEEFCFYIRNCIGFEDTLDFVGMAHNSPDCVKLCQAEKPDILLLDMQMETYTAGADAIIDIKLASPKTKIIVLTIHNERQQIFSALINGADDYRLKTSSIEELFEAIHNVYNNIHQLKPEITKALVDECNKIKNENMSLLYVLNTITKLTTSEYRILNDLCQGLSYTDIAKKRYVEITTIRSQASRILKKFNTPDMTSLIKTLNGMQMFDLLKKADQYDK